MNRHVVDVGVLRERASATPRGGGGPAAKPGLASRAAPRARDIGAEDQTLRGRQEWFARAVTTPESEPGAAASEADRLLTAGPRMSALERLEIYRRAYHSRLVECLADDYPVMQHALGQDAFESLCRGYVARHPSDGPNLNMFGRRMEAFCRHEAPAPFALRGMAADLASLEWAIVEVIHAPSSPPLTHEGMREVPMESWPEASLVPNTAFRLLRFDYPVNAYFQAYREGADPAIPEVAACATAVYRSGPTVWRMDLTPAMFAVLSALAAGEALGESLGRAGPHMEGLEEEEAARCVMEWFREWVGSGLFVAVRAGPGGT